MIMHQVSIFNFENNTSTGMGALEMTDFKPKDVNYVNPKKVVLIGARSIDNEEAILIKESGMTVFTMTAIGASIL